MGQQNSCKTLIGVHAITCTCTHVCTCTLFAMKRVCIYMYMYMYIHHKHVHVVSSYSCMYSVQCRLYLGSSSEGVSGHSRQQLQYLSDSESWRTTYLKDVTQTMKQLHVEQPLR